jgi:hypothetical protein
LGSCRAAAVAATAAIKVGVLKEVLQLQHCCQTHRQTSYQETKQTWFSQHPNPEPENRHGLHPPQPTSTLGIIIIIIMLPIKP